MVFAQAAPESELTGWLLLRNKKECTGGDSYTSILAFQKKKNVLHNPLMCRDFVCILLIPLPSILLKYTDFVDVSFSKHAHR